MYDFVKRAIVILIIIVICAGVFFYNKNKKGDAQPQQERGPMPVQVETPVIKDVKFHKEFTGYTVAIQDVDIRARVPGILQKINFVKGQRIEKGMALFEIEPDTYIVARDKAMASLTSAKANLERSEQDYKRAVAALKDNAVSELSVRAMKADKDMAKANLMAAEATLRNAEINLSYTKIVSPISGRVERHFVDAGNLVGTDMTLLTTVVQTDPMIVSFHISEDSLVELLRSNSLPTSDMHKPFYLSLANEDDYKFQGELDFLESSIETSTGTIEVRGQVSNADEKLFPGMFVRVRIPAGTKKNAIMIDEKAVGTGLDGRYVYIVDENNVVVQQNIKATVVIDGFRVAEEGLTGDEKYIASGIQFIRPGMAVKPMAAGDKESQPKDSDTPNK